MKIIYLLSLLLTVSAFSQSSEISNGKAIKSYSSFYEKSPTKVLVVGTFHFDYPGLDEVKTAEKDKIDVLKEPKKSEITELVDYIKRFKPNKIAIEAWPSWNVQEKYTAYKAGKKDNERDERYQLGMRIAQELGIDELHPIDAGSLKGDLWKKDSTFTKSLFNKIDWEKEDPFWKMAEPAFIYDDKLKKELSLLEYFKYTNTREGHNFNYGLYLTGSFETGDNQGADHLSIWWYNRNLRMFKNIQKITNDSNDRVLVIVGNGHASILRQLFEASPEFDFVEFSSLDK